MGGYRGTSFFQQHELESIRRMRESGVLGKAQQSCPNCGAPMNENHECPEEGMHAGQEGGPGSGPHASSGRVAHDHGMGARHEKLKKALKDANSRMGANPAKLDQVRSSLRAASAAMRKGDYNSVVDHHDNAAAALKSMGRFAPSEHDF